MCAREEKHWNTHSVGHSLALISTTSTNTPSVSHSLARYHTSLSLSLTMGAEHEELQPAVAGEDLAALHHSPDQQVDVAPSRDPNDAAIVDDETVVVVTLDPPATKPSSFMQQFANEHVIISRYLQTPSLTAH